MYNINTWQYPVITGTAFLIIFYLIFINAIFISTDAPSQDSSLQKLHPSIPSLHDDFPLDIGFHGDTAQGRVPSLRSAPVHSGTYYTNYTIEGKPDSQDLLHHWGALSPYFISDGFGIEEEAMPSQCRVKQVHVLSRHGARYPTAGSSLSKFAEKWKDVNATGELSFLNDWTYDLGTAVLVPIGKQQLYDSGVFLTMQYGNLLQSKEKLVYRSTSQTRMTESALSFLEGVYGGDWKEHANLELIIEASGYNNTLSPYLTCPNSNKQMFGSRSRRSWENIYLAAKTEHFRNLTTSDWTIQDTVSLQLLCPYETVALGYSKTCELFDWTEWMGFDYAESLWFQQNCAFGAPTGRAQGIGWVNELIRRIEKTPYEPTTQSSENATLDANEKYFPLTQNVYVDFTHDSVLASVITALGFTQFNTSMPDTGPAPGGNYYSTSKLTPFAARLYVEVIDCDDDTYLHFIMNQRTLPYPESDSSNGWIKQSDFLDRMKDRNELASWNHACYEDYPLDKDFTDGRP